MEVSIILTNFIGFEWDHGNQVKNWEKHDVTTQECEQVFFNKPLLIYDDSKHSKDEKRSYVLGRTDKDRFLFIVFTERKQLIRVISARDMSKKEHTIYEQIKENTKI
jgi:hypothetical protein